jgi:tRNA A-37 threonylcarbamoyl transferase component Bud32/TolB-like protein/tetratricopeptide (TPR) repeat protein
MDLRDQLAAALSNYAIERELGGGGMSRVFLATEVALSRRVVIKLLPPELAHAVSLDRFRQEIRLAASLQHPHLVPILAAGEADGLLYYTMPFVEGESLRARLARSGELSLREAIRVLRDVAAALDYAHQRGIIHRDIKPDNVLLSGGEALVTDFGVAKALTASSTAGETGLTELGVALGTPAYMAPEQAAADPHVDHRADLYAFGCLAYECLSGEPPFAGRPTRSLLAAQLTETPEPLARRRPNLPPALTTLVMRCLEKRPADRPQTAGEVLSVLDGAMTPSGEAAPTVRVEAIRPRRRWPALVAIAAGVIVLVGGAALLKARSGPRMTPSAAFIAVMPLTPASPDSALARLGRDLTVTLSANLDGVGEIRTVDALTILAQVRPSEATPSLTDAAALSRRLGAKSVLQGTLVRTGGMVRADIGLFTTDSSTAVTRVTASGSLDDVTGLTDSITWAVLRQVWRSRGSPTPSIAAVTTHSVPALRAFLEGERAITKGQFGRAEEAFGRALEADSSFWLAYRRYEFARSYNFKPVDSVIVTRYRANRQRLPERERLLIEALMPDSLSESMARLQELTRRFPDFWPAWWEYAEELTHEGGLLGHTRQEAQAALERTVALNPDLTGAWDHLLWMGIKNRDSAATRRALAANARVHIDSLWLEAGQNYYRGLRLAAYEFLAPDSAPALVDSVLLETPAKLASVVLVSYGFPKAQIELSRRALRRGLVSDGEKDQRRVIATAFAAAGAWDSALAAADDVVGEDPSADGSLFRYRQAVAAAWLGAVDPTAASRRRPAGTPQSPAGAADIVWLDGVLAYARGDRAALEHARESLKSSPDSAAPDLVRSLSAFESYLRRDHSRAAADLGRLERERAQLHRNDDAHPLLAGIDRLAASRWLVAAGDTAQALSLLHWTETVLAPHGQWILMNRMLSGPALLEQARLEDRQGHAEEARRAYAQFLGWYELAGTREQPLVREAQSALARLAGMKEVVHEP